jgi:hypothetical protein
MAFHRELAPAEQLLQGLDLIEGQIVARDDAQPRASA